MNKIKNNNYDIIFLIITSRSDIYDKLIEIYWKPFIKYLKEKKYRIKIYFMFGNDVILNDLNLSSEDYIVTNSPENLIPGILKKTLNSFKYIEENYKYKYILRTNLSSFFILDNLITLSKNLPNEDLYAGVIGNHNNILFGSGAAFWLSRDNILFILDNKEKINLRLPDDVAIGDLMKDKKRIILNRYDLDKNINYDNKNELLKSIISNNDYHIRIKNPQNRLIDLEYFKSFTEILYNI